MAQQQKQRERKTVLRRTPPHEIMEEARQGNKFIVVDDSFDHSYIPIGYMLIDKRYNDGSLKALVPQNLLFFMANPGGGDVDDALDEIADFYDNIRDFEDDLLEESDSSVEGTDWAVAARKTNLSYLTHKISLPEVVEQVFNKGEDIGAVLSSEKGYRSSRILSGSGKEIDVYHPSGDDVSGLEVSDRLIEKSGEHIVKESFGYLRTKDGKTTLIRANNRDMDVIVEDSEQVRKLDLDDDYVARRVKAIAAIRLGKTAEQVRGYGLGDVLRHVTINERKVEKLTGQEFDRITCWAGSHYEIKDEYRHDPDVDYRIDQRHDTSHKVGEKITRKQDVAVLDAKVAELEQQIDEYRREKHGSTGRQDGKLIRLHTNLVHIAKEDPKKQLEISPGSRRRK